MDIKFDSTAAEYLIEKMDSYCQCMQKEATELLDILEYSGKWDDPQAQAFHNNIMEISNNLVQAMKLESDYMNVFQERVNESTEQMVIALQYSQEYLSGNQFEKAKQTTLNCIEITGKTSNNITNAITYICKLKEIVDRYSMCGYSNEENDL